MSRVTLHAVSMTYGAHTALHETDLDIAEGEFLVLLGPSGCGKTTTLRMIAGLVMPTTGRVLIDEEDVTHLPPQRRRIGMVFQDYALFPHMTIADNIGFGLRERGQGRSTVRARVAELLDLIRLPDLADRYPAQISGGQQQRVALARAIAYPPRVLLMDEPLAALDLKLRETMQTELRRIQKELRITTVFVTHDQTEAMNLSDSIAVMGEGRVIQHGTAQEIYDRPRTRYVANFVGQVNFLEGAVVGQEGSWQVMQAGGVRMRVKAAAPAGGRATLAVRPQHLTIQNGVPLSGEFDRLEGDVVGQTFFGNLCQIKVSVADALWTVEARPGEHAVTEGQRVMLGWRPDHAMLLAE